MQLQTNFKINTTVSRIFFFMILFKQNDIVIKFTVSRNSF
jgi:hypothetical protein